VSDHSVTYRVHDFTCDGLGHLYTGNYLRYIHDAGRAAWRCWRSKAGIDGEMRAAWMPAKTVLDLNKPVFSGEEITLQTRMLAADTRSAHVYTTLHAGDSGDPAATCQVRWTVLNEEATEDASPAMPWLSSIEGSNEELTWLQPAAESSPPPGALNISRRVGWRDISPRGTVFAAAFMDFMVDSGIRAGEKYGWDFHHSMDEGFAFVARRQWIDLHMPLHLNDEFDIQTWLYNVRRTTAYRVYVLRRKGDDRLVAYGHTYWAAVDVNTGRPVRIPEAFKEDLADHIATD